MIFSLLLRKECVKLNLLPSEDPIHTAFTRSFPHARSCSLLIKSERENEESSNNGDRQTIAERTAF